MKRSGLNDIEMADPIWLTFPNVLETLFHIL